MGQRPPLHILIYGDPCGGKSTFASTTPRPMLVFAFDPVGKSVPYLKRGSHHEEGEWEFGRFTEIRDDKENLIRIEHYSDVIPERPTAWRNFTNRLAKLDPEEWQTLVFDSVTFMELSARKNDQYRVNKGARDPRQHYAASKEALEETLMMRIAGYRCNVVTIAHIDEVKDEVNGVMVRNPAFPGKLSKRAPAAYSEVYRAYVSKDEKGHTGYYLQTASDGRYNASTQIDADDPSVPDFRGLWASYEEV